MDTARFVGTTSVRVATLLFAAASVGLAVAGGERAFWPALVAGLLAFVCLTHSSAGLFRGWMHVAEALQAVAIRALFTVFYLLIVPIFTLALRRNDPLRRRHRARDSAWVRREPHVEAGSLERMG